MGEIGHQIDELAHLLSKTEVLIHENVENLLSIATRYENFATKLIESSQLDEIQVTLVDLLQTLQSKYDAWDANCCQRDGVLDTTYHQLTSKDSDLISRLQTNLNHLPTNSQKLANFVSSSRDLVDLVAKNDTNVEYLHDFIDSVNHVVQNFKEQ